MHSTLGHTQSDKQNVSNYCPLFPKTLFPQTLSEISSICPHPTSLPLCVPLTPLPRHSTVMTPITDLCVCQGSLQSASCPLSVQSRVMYSQLTCRRTASSDSGTPPPPHSLLFQWGYGGVRYQTCLSKNLQFKHIPTTGNQFAQIHPLPRSPQSMQNSSLIISCGQCRQIDKKDRTGEVLPNLCVSRCGRVWLLIVQMAHTAVLSSPLHIIGISLAMFKMW